MNRNTLIILGIAGGVAALFFFRTRNPMSNRPQDQGVPERTGGDAGASTDPTQPSRFTTGIFGGLNKSAGSPKTGGLDFSSSQI